MIFQNKYNCKIEDLKRKSINSLRGCEVWQSWQRWLQDDTRRATLLQECTIRATLLQFWACHCAHKKAAGVGLWPTKLVMTSGLTTDCSVLPDGGSSSWFYQHQRRQHSVSSCQSGSCYGRGGSWETRERNVKTWTMRRTISFILNCLLRYFQNSFTKRILKIISHGAAKLFWQRNYPCKLQMIYGWAEPFEKVLDLIREI